MDVKTTVVLYSRFSQSCTAFLPLLDRLPLEVQGRYKLKALNIDSPKVRSIVLSAGVKAVPCVQVVYGNGTSQKYEGTLAFDWVTGILGRQDGGGDQGGRDSPAVDVETQSTQIKSLELETLRTKLENVEKALEETQQKLLMKGEVRAPAAPSRRDQKAVATSLSDLPDISGDDSETDAMIDDTIDDGWKRAERERDARDGAIKRSYADEKADSLKNSAAQMQKQREELEESYSRGRKALA